MMKRLKTGLIIWLALTILVVPALGGVLKNR